jgi:hypothetical protein
MKRWFGLFAFWVHDVREGGVTGVRRSCGLRWGRLPDIRGCGNRGSQIGNGEEVHEGGQGEVTSMDNPAEREKAIRNKRVIAWAILVGAACGGLWGAFFGYFFADPDVGLTVSVTMHALILCGVGALFGEVAAIGFRMITGKCNRHRVQRDPHAHSIPPAPSDNAPSIDEVKYQAS